jgi:hypothetical protein
MSASGSMVSARAIEHKAKPRRGATLRGFFFCVGALPYQLSTDAIIPQPRSHMQAQNDKFPMSPRPPAGSFRDSPQTVVGIRNPRPPRPCETGRILIYSWCCPSHSGNREEVGNLADLINFLLAVAASIVGHYVCKWLDSRRKGK